MKRTYKKLRQRRSGKDVEGFTLIEILIVIVVLGILAAVVIYALGGIGSKSAVASCEADGSTVSAALADFNNINPHLISMIQGTNQVSDVDFNSPPSSYSDATSADAVLTNKSLGGPFIQSWPNNYPHYAFQLTWEEVPGTGTNATTNPGLWSLKLQVATGNKQSPTPPYSYSAAGGAGNLVSVATSTNQNVPGSAYAPWIDYTGPGTCTGVS